MPVFEFTSPDGQTYEVEGPDGASEAQAFAILQQRISPGGVNPETGRLRVNVTAQAPEGRGGSGIMEKADAFVRGAADVLTLGFADEIAAGADTLFKGGSYDENLSKQRSVDRYDADEHGTSRVIGQIAGGFALPVGKAKSAAGLAKVGAAYGGAYGVGSGEGVKDRAAKGAFGAATGGATGYAFGKAGDAIVKRLNRAPQPDSAGKALLAAYDRLEIEPLAADVAGATTGRVTSAVAQTPFGARPIVKASQRVAEQSQAARDRIASRVGDVVSTEEAGDVARRGAQSFIKRTSNTARQLYDKAGKLAGDLPIDPANARQVLDRNIDELSRIPGGGKGAGTLQELRKSLEGQFTVDGLRGMRSTLRDEFTAQGLRGSDIERRVGQVIDATADDIANGLIKAGRPEAAKAYKLADRYYRNRISTIDDALAPIIGKDGSKSGEQIVKALQQASKSNANRLASFVRALPPEDQATVRATLISELGKATAGAQNREGTAFSLNRFLTHWNEMTPRSRRILFPDDARVALDDLARVAEGAKQASKYANASQTGGVVATLATGATIPDPVTFTMIGGGQYGAGRLLASPRFARWLARAPKNPSKMPAYVDRLGRIAVAEPQIAPQVLMLQERLAQAFTQTPLRAAAENEERD